MKDSDTKNIAATFPNRVSRVSRFSSARGNKTALGHGKQAEVACEGGCQQKRPAASGLLGESVTVVHWAELG